jgi:hypothetical protein
MSTKNSVSIGIEALERRTEARRQVGALIELIHHHCAEILPAIDHMPVTHPERTHLLNCNGTLLWPSA